jgi:hypothetical protein
MRAVGRSLRVVLILGQLLFLAVSLYQTTVTVLGRRRPAPRQQPMTEGGVRFGLVVCARDEAHVIRGAVAR